ncbi:FMRFamide-activated amiloride-sensitive sodium channel-like [Stegodyphus dumicola]|uniref:FMRFamide-activated amiloride-sensitive sodium channel-like n=1 Tax=Stegodyphus dumicola TaxID=202533 RepID=UPI0015AE8999|nr:FMRFamide-activated amiloride-sensitive sodium channel-like [Stegodyphus dumicola]
MSASESNSKVSSLEIRTLPTCNATHEKENENLKFVILNLLKKSSVYAVSQLVTSSGSGRKFLWFLVLILGLLGCSYEVYRFLNLYFQYPVVITLEVKNNWKLDFPAVTVCNLNRVPKFYYHCLINNKTIDECEERNCGGRQFETFRRVVASERKKYVSCSKNFEGMFSDERIEWLTFLNRYLDESEEARRKMGYKGSSFITSCSFNGESCSIRNFSEYLSIEFGNCFTFNGRYNGEEETPLETPYIGPNSGLELTLNLDVASYVPITTSAGARVVLHESDILPNPEDYGFNISPGYETSVAIRQMGIYRLPYPYRDKCKKYAEESGGMLRNQEGCIRNCIQNRNFLQCGCVDPFLPANQSLVRCDLRNQTSVCCLEDVIKSVSESDVPCFCPLPCKTKTFEMTVSTAEWPSFAYFNKFMKSEDTVRRPCLMARNKVPEDDVYDISSINQTMFPSPNETTRYGSFLSNEENSASDSLSSDNEECSGEFIPWKCCDCEDIDPYTEKKRQSARLKVFYSSLEKTYYKQEPMFQESELFSQLGGQLGLWLGVSLVALFECLENISHLIHYFIKKSGWKPKPSLSNSFRVRDTKITEKITSV